MPLLTLGDSHALFLLCWRSGRSDLLAWTCHDAPGCQGWHKLDRAGNFKPSRDDVVVLHLVRLIAGLHIPKIASGRQTSTRAEKLWLFATVSKRHSFNSQKSTLHVWQSRVSSLRRRVLLTEYYRSADECFEDAIAIRDVMNHRLSGIAPLIDFRHSFRSDRRRPTTRNVRWLNAH